MVLVSSNCPQPSALPLLNHGRMSFSSIFALDYTSTKCPHPCNAIVSSAHRSLITLLPKHLQPILEVKLRENFNLLHDPIVYHLSVKVKLRHRQQTPFVSLCHIVSPRHRWMIVHFSGCFFCFAEPRHVLSSVALGKHLSVLHNDYQVSWFDFQ